MFRLKYMILVTVTFMMFTQFAKATALHDYVAKPDENYAWRFVAQHPYAEGTMYVLHMASQAWRTGKDVDRILWRHWLVIYVPEQVEHDTVFLMIGAGDNSYHPPDQPDALLVKMATENHAVTADLFNVPNQPLIFLADEDLRSRTEDDILAFGWARFLETDDPEWLVNLPMTKSAVRAMDTITEFCMKLEDRNIEVNKFMVSGASKRGWTTWLTAAVDQRIVAIAPMVFDVLNMEPSMEHHVNAYGEYSSAISPYVENGILEALHTPRTQASLEIIDPYSYRQHLKMPKVIINSTGDQFFLPDSSKFYYNDLRGPKYLRYIPNTYHNLDYSAGETLRSFYASILADKPLPEYSWQIPETGKMIVHVRDKPLEVKLWQARNPKTRDFRLETIGGAWKNSVLEPTQKAEDSLYYEVEMKPPAEGWIAFLVELTFPDPVREGQRLTFTTEVSVVPDTLPYEKNKRSDK